MGNSYLANAISFFLYLLFRPHFIPLALKKIYLPVYAQFEWLKKYQFATLVDVGASEGWVTRVLHHLFPASTIYAFEPIKTEADKIKALNSENIIVENIALSNKSTEATFFKHGFGPVSSLLSPLPAYEKKLEELDSFEKVIVKTTTLDTYFKNKKIRGLVFLKLDTQGTEKLILEGGEKFLEKVSVIHIETSFIKLYKDQSLFKDVYDFLTEHGFEYKGSDNEAYFYPVFGEREIVNSVFIRP